MKWRIGIALLLVIVGITQDNIVYYILAMAVVGGMPVVRALLDGIFKG